MRKRNIKAILCGVVLLLSLASSLIGWGYMDSFAMLAWIRSIFGFTLLATPVMAVLLLVQCLRKDQ